MSDEEIDYPKASPLDLLLAMSQDACDEHYQFLKPEGILIIDSTYVSQSADAPVYAIPCTRIAREKLGRENVANIVALGAITQLFPHISAAAMEKAVLGRVPKQFVELNKKAFQAGIDAAAAELKTATGRVEKRNDEV
jgi:2-oxoglutarate ferredoxin oxidoreductase subunit gamma